MSEKFERFHSSAQSVLNSAKSLVSRKAKAPEVPPASTGRDTFHPSTVAVVKSTAGITKSVAAVAALYVAYHAASVVTTWIENAQDKSDEAEHNRDKARRDLVNTKIKQDKKDTKAIEQQIHDAFTERERNKVRFRPKSVRGHWEGQVFIPSEAQAPKPRK